MHIIEKLDLNLKLRKRELPIPLLDYIIMMVMCHSLCMYNLYMLET